MGKAIINYDAATTNELLGYVKEIKDGGGINLDAPKDGNLYGQQDGEWKQAQEKLVDGESIKTLNGVSVLGSGNIDVAPTIGDNGNWFINGEDTGKPSKGTDGKNGADGVSLGEIALVQETGTESGSENKVMSQKAVSTKFSELDKKFNELNISTLYPTQGIGGSNKYDLTTAIAQVPAEYRSIQGLKITFINNTTGKTETWKYDGGTFTSTTNWKQGDGSGGNLILEWNTDVATTRKQVPLQERNKGIQISYEHPDLGMVCEQYIGENFTDTYWSADGNWDRILTELDYEKRGYSVIKEYPGLKNDEGHLIGSNHSEYSPQYTDISGADYIDAVVRCFNANSAGITFWNSEKSKIIYYCPIKILQNNKIRADFICEVSPFSLDFSRQTIKSNYGQKYTF